MFSYINIFILGKAFCYKLLALYVHCNSSHIAFFFPFLFSSSSLMSFMVQL